MSDHFTILRSKGLITMILWTTTQDTKYDVVLISTSSLVLDNFIFPIFLVSCERLLHLSFSFTTKFNCNKINWILQVTSKSELKIYDVISFSVLYIKSRRRQLRNTNIFVFASSSDTGHNILITTRPYVKITLIWYYQVDGGKTSFLKEINHHINF